MFLQQEKFKQFSGVKMEPYNQSILKNENLDTLILNRVQEVYDNGIKYIGEKKDNQFHGFGSLTFTNGEIYEGEFKNNKRNGYGKRFIKNDILVYEGEWLNDKYQGRGILYNPQFQPDVTINPEIFQNFDQLQNTQWEKFEGEFQEGKWHGVGILSFSNGQKYNGQFQNNSIHGFGGIYNNDNLISYVGKWEKSVMISKY